MERLRFGARGFMLKVSWFSVVAFRASMLSLNLRLLNVRLSRPLDDEACLQHGGFLIPDVFEKASAIWGPPPSENSGISHPN